jgi:ribosome-associated protein
MPAMDKLSPSSARVVFVRETPIELCQFLKFGGLAGSGGEAKQRIADGHVLVNGTLETRKRKKLTPGDHVTLDGETLVVQVGTPG